ncbi:hypothetical protein DFH06DRAFT_765799 [Mycena polygramma]|nr:hypothetical protein DFH06DRAFT_765799 [Mycena polygramma]
MYSVIPGALAFALAAMLPRHMRKREGTAAIYHRDSHQKLADSISRVSWTRVYWSSCNTKVTKARTKGPPRACCRLTKLSKNCWKVFP